MRIPEKLFGFLLAALMVGVLLGWGWIVGNGIVWAIRGAF